MIIRPATEADIPQVLAIWNPVIRNTTIIFHNEERTETTVKAIWAERRKAGHEFFVADEAGTILGFATYAQFRGGNGYTHALEHSIILHPAANGRGIGRRLMEAVEDHARAAGGHTLFAGVSGENEAGLAFHKALGFDHVGRFPEAGRKFGRWLDLVLMMKFL